MQPSPPDASPAGPPARPFPLWWLVLATTATQAFASMSTMSPSTVAPALGASLDLPTSLIGYLVTMIYAGAIATSLIGGAVVRRLGGCRASQLALALCATGILLVAGGWLPALALGAFVMGLGYGFTNPAASHLLSRFATGPRINLIFSIKQTGVPWGGMLAGLLIPSAALAVGWQGGILLVALFCLILMLLLQISRRHWDDDRDPGIRLFTSPLAAIALVWRSKGLRLISLAAMTLSFSQLCFTTFLVALLVEELSYTLVAAGLVLSLSQVVSVAARLLWGWMADRLGDSLKVLKLLIGLLILAAATVPMLAPDWPVAAIYGVFMLIGATAVGWNGVYMAAVARLAPAGQIGAATGGSLVLTFAGVVGGPAAFAASTGLTGGYAASYVLIVLAGLAGLVCIILAQRHLRAHLRTGDPA